MLLVYPGLLLAVDPINKTTFGGLAIDGYDAVAYFTESKPQRGNRQFEITYKGAKWRFKNQTNLDLFKANPTKYVPQYGGYCAYAIAQGYTADIDPTAWKIVNGKLYLNYDKDIQHKWENEQSKFISDADKNWVRMGEKSK